MPDDPLTQPATQTDPPEPAAPGATQVPPDPTPPPDPYEPRFASLERQIAGIAGLIQRVQPSQPAPQGPKDLSDEELWALAQQGNRQAFELYQERIADRRFQQRFTAQRHEDAVTQQLAVLYQRYPELSDPQNPLTQRAVAFKNVLIQMGGQNSRQTDLDAILRAVADSRDLISKPASQAPPARVAAASGQIGAMHRAASAPKPTPGVSDAEASVAKKMGIKDPKGALERFQKRQDEGRSTVSPTIVSAVREA